MLCAQGRSRSSGGEVGNATTGPAGVPHLPEAPPERSRPSVPSNVPSLGAGPAVSHAQPSHFRSRRAQAAFPPRLHFRTYCPRTPRTTPRSRRFCIFPSSLSASSYFSSFPSPPCLAPGLGLRCAIDPSVARSAACVIYCAEPRDDGLIPCALGSSHRDTARHRRAHRTQLAFEAGQVRARGPSQPCGSPSSSSCGA